MKIVVGGAISLPPFSPGTAWDRLHYVLGFLALGHDVRFVEEVEPDWCADPSGRPCGFEQSVNRARFCATMEELGLLGRACQLYDGGRATAGLGLESLMEFLEGADLLVNISGHVRTELVLGAVKVRLYLDQDPVYTQLWRSQYGADLGLENHDLVFTVGGNIGTRHSPMPDCGLTWHHCLPPVLLEHWPYRFTPASKRFTTVASWGRYEDLSYRGDPYRSKREQFRRFAELPERVEQELEVALGAVADADPDVGRLREAGWTVREAAELAGLSSYRTYIARSRAEIGIAKDAYVKGRSGWIGDRSACYLASGKPVLAQSTGQERLLPSGEGLVTFTDIDQAVAGVREINRDYEAHARAARELAEQFLDARKVLASMLETAAPRGVAIRH
jgi:hypothetical protein